MSPRPPGENHFRRFFCRHYGRCLDIAIQRSWPGFDCSECGDSELVRMDEGDMAEQALLSLILWYCVFHPEAWQGQSITKLLEEREI